MTINRRQVVACGYASGAGSENQGSKYGPDAIQKGFSEDSALCDIPWQAIVREQDTGTPVHSFNAIRKVANLNTQLAMHVHTVIQAGGFPLVFGGDHASGIGTWSGVAKGLGGPLGLIWIDAHMDAHTFQTTPSGFIHGMPLAALLGYGRDELTTIASPLAKVSPENICLIGTRDYEEGEAAFLREHGVRIYYIDEVYQRGLPTVLAEAHHTISSRTHGFGLSIDLDAFSAEEVPGVATTSGEGLNTSEFLSYLPAFAKDNKLLALELAEFNPALDIGNKTLSLIKGIVKPFQEGAHS